MLELAFKFWPAVVPLEDVWGLDTWEPGGSGEGLVQDVVRDEGDGVGVGFWGRCSRGSELGGEMRRVMSRSF